jgi:hypothetical protein
MIQPHPHIARLFYLPLQQKLFSLSFTPIQTLSIGTIADLSLKHPNTFHPNPEFEKLLHSTFKKYVHLDPSLQGLALSQKVGYMTLHDLRVFTPFGRVADPEDLLGSVLLDQGKIVPHSYDPMPTYRLLSSHGITELSDFMHEKLLQELNLLPSLSLSSAI